MFRVVTYNIHGGVGSDGRRSLERIAQTLGGLSADAVGVQEAHRRWPTSDRTDQPAALSEFLGRDYVFQQTAVYGYRTEGLAFFSRQPCGSVLHHALPGEGEPRGALEAIIARPDQGQRVRCFTTHWGLRPQERRTQAIELVRLIGASGEPTIVCGDLNEGPEGEALRLLLARTGLKDAGEHHGLPTFPAVDPTARIDYILASPGLRVRAVETIGSQASDHLVFVADFE